MVRWNAGRQEDGRWLASATSGSAGYPASAAVRSAGPSRAAIVFVCEGEKAADAARSWGGGNRHMEPRRARPTGGPGRSRRSCRITIRPAESTPTRWRASWRIAPAPVVKGQAAGLDHGDLVEWIEAHGDARNERDA